MSTENLENEDNIVPEPTAANPDGGAERLDADPIGASTHEALDALLDEAERETTEPTHENDTTLDPNAGEQGQGTPQEPAPEDQPANSAPAAPAAGDTTGTPPVLAEGGNQGTEIDPEILAIEQPRNLSEKNQNNWRKLQETASTYKKQAQEAEVLRQKLAEAEARPTQTPPDYEELRKFRAVFDIKNDPDFKSKYVEPLNNAAESIYGILKKHGASDEVIDNIKKAGGPDKVSDEWWQKNAINKLPFQDSERLKRGLLDIYDLKDKQQSEIENAAQNAEKILEERKNASVESYRRDTEQITNHLQEITKEIPWARYQEIPQGATEEQVQAAQKHNQMVAQLEQKFNAALWPTDAVSRANIAASAVLSDVLAGQLRQDQARMAQMAEQLKKLTEENSKLKGASKVPRQNVSTQSTIKTSSLNDRIKMNSMDAIDMGLNEALGD
jgi:hypothetical protein